MEIKTWFNKGDITTITDDGTVVDKEGWRARIDYPTFFVCLTESFETKEEAEQDARLLLRYFEWSQND